MWAFFFGLTKYVLLEPLPSINCEFLTWALTFSILVMPLSFLATGISSMEEVCIIVPPPTILLARLCWLALVILAAYMNLPRGIFLTGVTSLLLDALDNLPKLF